MSFPVFATEIQSTQSLVEVFLWAKMCGFILGSSYKFEDLLFDRYFWPSPEFEQAKYICDHVENLSLDVPFPLCILNLMPHAFNQ